VSEGAAALAPCVHCGFCLQSCPTYLVTGDESDSPRGRIVLMQAVQRGVLSPTDPQVTRHLDRCLGCRGCEPVCPSGVAYGIGLEEVRATIARRRPPTVLARVVLAVMAMAPLRQTVLAVARVLRPMIDRMAGPGRLGFALGMLGSTRETAEWQDSRVAGQHTFATLPTCPPAASAVLFLGCIQRELFAHVHAATRRTLAANGIRTIAVRQQGCCGALHAHAGLLDEARALARANIRAFAAQPERTIVVNAAGCGAMLKEYDRLLAHDPLAEEAKVFASRVRDVTETLAERGPRRGGPLALRVAYDPPCHLLHAQRVIDPPRAVLAAVPELDVVEHEDADRCCGSAGIYGLLEPALSRAVLDRKIAALRAVAPAAIVTGNPGCAMQLGAGLRAVGDRTPVMHPVELLDRSYHAAGFYGGAGVDYGQS